MRRATASVPASLSPGELDHPEAEGGREGGTYLHIVSAPPAGARIRSSAWWDSARHCTRPNLANVCTLNVYVRVARDCPSTVGGAFCRPTGRGTLIRDSNRGVNDPRHRSRGRI